MTRHEALRRLWRERKREMAIGRTQPSKNDIQRIAIHGILELPVSSYPPDDESCQTWLLENILLGTGGIVLHSIEIGDELGPLHITSVKPLPA